MIEGEREGKMEGGRRDGEMNKERGKKRERKQLRKKGKEGRRKEGRRREGEEERSREEARKRGSEGGRVGGRKGKESGYKLYNGAALLDNVDNAEGICFCHQCPPLPLEGIVNNCSQKQIGTMMAALRYLEPTGSFPHSSM